MNKLKEKAISLGAQELKRSTRKNKKLAVLYNDKWLYIGDRRYMDYTQHRNEKRRKNYLTRTKGIRDSKGNLTYNNKNTANYWARTLLWDG
jgi:hypothetical protein